jgi:hypothetical protein
MSPLFLYKAHPAVGKCHFVFVACVTMMAGIEQGSFREWRTLIKEEWRRLGC